MTRASHGKCGATWEQRGNSTSHCAGCHETFSTLGLFERHRRGGGCVDVTEGLIQDEELVWWSPEGLENLYRLQEVGRERFGKGDGDV